jgi:riboflavin biosynthesis pyrimidine reductase
VTVVEINGDSEALFQHYPHPADAVRANMIFTADGAAAIGGRVQRITCRTDQLLFHHLRTLADVILVGAATARAEGYGPIRPPQRIAVLSRTGCLPSAMFGGPVPPIVVTDKTAAESMKLRTGERPEVLIAGEHQVDIAAAIGLLRAAGMRRVLCEGGPTVLDEISRAGLLDEICVTIAPRLAGIQPVGVPPGPRLEFPIEMRLRHALVHEDYLYLRYVRRRGPDHETDGREV